MHTYKLNLHFKTLAECNEWEKEHIIDNKYNGEFVMMIAHEESIGSDEVVLTEIYTV